MLVATVVGSGIMAERLAGGNLAVALLANTAATVAVLGTLVALLGPVSGAHFNPAVTLIMALRGRLSWPDALAYMLAQVLGARGALFVARFLFAAVNLSACNPSKISGHEAP